MDSFNAQPSLPPVTQVVLGCYFEPLPGLTTFHLPRVLEVVRSALGSPATPIEMPMGPPVVFEGGIETTPVVQFTGPTSGRLFIGIESNPEVAVQVQNDRLLLNWRAVEGGIYPGFSSLESRFVKLVEDLYSTHRFQMQLASILYVNNFDGKTLSEIVNLPGVSESEGATRVQASREVQSETPFVVDVTMESRVQFGSPTSSLVQIEARGTVETVNALSPLTNNMHAEIGRTYTVVKSTIGGLVV